METKIEIKTDTKSSTDLQYKPDLDQPVEQQEQALAAPIAQRPPRQTAFEFGRADLGLALVMLVIDRKSVV